MKTVLSIIGSIRSKIFVSSTCVTVQSLQGPRTFDVDAASTLALEIAALSKNLEFAIQDFNFSDELRAPDTKT